MPTKTKSLVAALTIAATACLPLPTTAALADQHFDFQVNDIEIVNDGTNNAMYVRGAFTPALPCSVQGFVYFSADAYSKEVTALLVSAKLTGRAASYVHSYCVSGGAHNGYGRGNGYVLK